jgi:hypothetical protein
MPRPDQAQARALQRLQRGGRDRLRQPISPRRCTPAVDGDVVDFDAALGEQSVKVTDRFRLDLAIRRALRSESAPASVPRQPLGEAGPVEANPASAGAARDYAAFLDDLAARRDALWRTVTVAVTAAGEKSSDSEVPPRRARRVRSVGAGRADRRAGRRPGGRGADLRHRPLHPGRRQLTPAPVPARSSPDQDSRSADPAAWSSPASTAATAGQSGHHNTIVRTALTRRPAAAILSPRLCP